MSDPGQRNFHLVMALLLMISCAIDQQDLGGWRAGRVGMVSLGLAVAWVGRYAMDGFRQRDATAKVHSNRIATLEERVDQLERESRARQGPFSAPPN